MVHLFFNRVTCLSAAVCLLASLCFVLMGIRISGEFFVRGKRAGFSAVVCLEDPGSFVDVHGIHHVFKEVL